MLPNINRNTGSLHLGVPLHHCSSSGEIDPPIPPPPQKEELRQELQQHKIQGVQTQKAVQDFCTSNLNAIFNTNMLPYITLSLFKI